MNKTDRLQVVGIIVILTACFFFAVFMRDAEGQQRIIIRNASAKVQFKEVEPNKPPLKVRLTIDVTGKDKSIFLMKDVRMAHPPTGLKTFDALQVKEVGYSTFYEGYIVKLEPITDYKYDVSSYTGGLFSEKMGWKNIMEPEKPAPR